MSSRGAGIFGRTVLAHADPVAVTVDGENKVPVFEELCLVVVSVGFWVGLVVGFPVVFGRVVGFVEITVVRTVEPSAIEPGTVPFVCSPVVFPESAVSPFGRSTSATIISSISSIIPSVSLSEVLPPRCVRPPDALFSTVLLSLVSDSRVR